MPSIQPPSTSENSGKPKHQIARRPLQVERLEERVVLATSLLQSADILAMANLEAQQEISSSRPYVPDELILAVRAAVSPLDPVSFFAGYSWPAELGSARIDTAEWIFSTSDSQGDPLSLLKVRFNEEIPLFAAMSALDSLPDVLWASLNFIYERPEEPRDLIPDDPLFGSQYHHALMQNIQAWDITQGHPSIIIAVTDDGVDIDHEDLAANIWINTGEIPGNGIDDDGNGYIDDVYGWDFSSNDNNPRPVGGDSHGTHVAGIAAAVTNNEIGIAGTAGNVTIMPIRFYGSGAWTSSVIAASFAYAVNNGAQIISTSYSIDHFWGDPTFTAGLQYLYDQGGLHFNSAGNNNMLNPARQQFDQSIFVANTNSLDKKSGSSNYGWGIDIAAPGTSIYATLPGDGYGTKSGTSMATPNVAGVAALIWSLNPTWTREQVVAQLLGTTDNIDALNPSYAGLLGSGRVNTYRALTETLAPPKIKGIVQLPTEGMVIEDGLSTITVELGSVFDPASIADLSHWELLYAGFDDIFGTEDDTVLSLTLLTNYMVGTNRLTFSVSAGMHEGHYRFIAYSGGLVDPFGTALDGNGDGIAGGDFVRNFTVDFPPAAFARVGAEGSMIYSYSTSDFTDPSLPAYVIDTTLLAGERLSVAVTAQNGSAALTLNVYDSQGLVHTASAAAGQRLLLNSALIASTDTHYFEVVSTVATVFHLRAYLNARIEVETSAGANDLIATAEDLSITSVELLPGVDRLAVAGVANGVDYYGIQLNAGQSVSVVSNAFTGSALSLQIRNAGGSILATGSTGSVTGQTAISNFVAATTGTYYVRVSGTGNRDYTVVATRGISFEIESNNTVATAMSLNGTHQVLGYLSTSAINGLLGLTIDPNLSLLTLSGNLIAIDSGAHFPIVQQRANSLRTRYDGTLLVVLNDGTIYFPGGSTLDARQQTTGNFQPGSAPADYGGRIVLIPNALQIDAAARNLIADASSGALAIDANGQFSAGGVTMLLTSGTLDYAITGATPESFLLSGFSSDNQSTDLGTITILPGQLRIDIPVVQNLSSEVPGIAFLVDMIISGQVTATKDVPELLDHYKIQVQQGQTVTIQTSTPRDDVLGNPRNDLDAFLTILDPSLVTVATDDNSAGDGRNASVTFVATTTGTYTIQVAALRGSGEYVLTAGIFDPPVAHAGGPYAIVEGGSLALDASLSHASHPNAILAYTWDVNGDGVFGDAVGVAPTLTWAQLVGLGIQDGASLHAVAVRVSDGLGNVVEANASLQINNAPPTANMSGPASVIRAFEAVFTLHADDPSPVDQAAPFTFHIDWDGDGNVDETVVGLSGVQVTHLFGTAGSHAVQVSATDKDGATSSVHEFEVEVTAYGLVADEGGVHLVFGGSEGDDHVEFEQIDATTILVKTRLENGLTLLADDIVGGVTGKVIAYGLGGDDQLIATLLSTTAVEFFGGTGNDTLRGGAADDLLFGEEDVDWIFGGLGNDFIDGGAGDDLLYGEWEDPPRGTIFGSDTIYGGEGNDTIYGDGDGGEGAGDLIDGGAGDDLIFGDGNLGKKSAGDTIHGGSGNDTIYGDGDGGEGGSDWIDGGEGDDLILADGAEGSKSANDTVYGGDGNDTIFGDGAEGGADSLFGGDGDDIIDTGHGNDYADGGDGNDLILGGDGGEGADDTLIGGNGNDMLVGGVGSDFLDGGPGEDLLIVANFLPQNANSLAAIYSEWASERPFAERVANIQGVGVGPRNNGDDFLIPGETVVDDGAIDTVLAGGAEEDWLFLKLGLDIHPDVGIEDIITGL